MNTWTNIWNEEYCKEGVAYCEPSNNYLKEQLEKLTIGTRLFLADGKGSNVVFAAKLCWKISAFDISENGKSKALLLSENSNVIIDYQVGESLTLNYKPEQFDAIALIYAHFPVDIASLYHSTLDNCLPKKWINYYDAFSKKHIEYIGRNEKVGRPKDNEVLFSIDEVKSDFYNHEIVELEERNRIE
jgi:hypothetical protein